MANSPVDSRDRRRKVPSKIRIDGDTAHVELTKGMEAMIDVADIDAVSAYTWIVAINPTYGNKYAVRYDATVKRQVSMHRQLLNPVCWLHVDHVDGNGLNNRRANIRSCTQGENQANKAAERRNKLGIKGVTKAGNRFSSSIKPDGRTIYLGTYATKEEASAAYFGAAKVLWGEFAKK